MNLTPWTRRERLAHAKPSSAEAGAKGKSAKPLTAQDRVNRYLAKGGTLTAAQKRRIVKKANAAGENLDDGGYSVGYPDGCSRDFNVIGHVIGGVIAETHIPGSHNKYGTRPVAVAS